MAEADVLGQVFDPNYDGEHGCTDFVPFTNADHIRAMSDDELSAFLCNLRSEEVYGNACSHCVAERFCRIGHNGMIDWLQQPAEGGLP